MKICLLSEREAKIRGGSQEPRYYYYSAARGPKIKRVESNGKRQRAEEGVSREGVEGK